MTQIIARNIQYTPGLNPLLQSVSFSVEDFDRIGLVGTNGCGKSTLFRLITEEIKPDIGHLFISDRDAIGMLDQNPSEHDLASFIQNHAVSSEFLKYAGILGLKDDVFEHIPSLSGGEHTKLALCVLFSRSPKLLLLDEPTNNLDYEGICALISIINSYPGTVISISHDRFFLDQTVDQIFELENTGLTIFQGNYSQYLQDKQHRFNTQMHHYSTDQKTQKRIQSQIKQKRAFSEKAHRESTKKDSSGNTMGLKEYKRVKAKKMDKKIKNDIRKLERLTENAAARPFEAPRIKMQLEGAGSHGKRVFEMDDLGMTFGEHALFEHSHAYVMRGEKVALFGPNGCGKTTLIEMLLGRLTPIEGTLWLSPSIDPAFLPQCFSGFPENIQTLEYLKDKLGRVSGSERTVLHQIGITEEMLLRNLSSLSFGEQMRLKLFEPILMKKTFVIFDEPTNHLDIRIRESLEKCLMDYEGTLLIASHDIRFLENVCDKVLYFKDHRIMRSESSFATFLENLEES